MPSDSLMSMILAFDHLDNGHSKDVKDAEAYRRSISDVISKRAKEKLPSCTRPSLYLPLDTTTLTPTDKMDKRRVHANLELLALDELLDTYGEPNPYHRSPSTELEKRMQQLRADALGTDIDRIGVNDSFISVGGESIEAMRLATMARQAGFEYSWLKDR